MQFRPLIRPGIILVFLTSVCYGQHSVLQNGPWFKLGVVRNGVYKIDASMLKKAGLDVAHIDPRQIAIYGNGAGMLPQPNNSARPSDLIENAIFVSGEDDGRFDNSDYILFYGEGPSSIKYDAGRNAFAYENNIYADTNYYFLTVGTKKGKRMTSRGNLAGTFPVISSFDDYVLHETDTYNELKSGRTWFGESFDLTTSRHFDFALKGIQGGSLLKLVSSVMAQSILGSSFRVSINGAEIGTQEVLPVPNQPYTLTGQLNLDTLLIDEETVGAASTSTLSVSYQYDKAARGRSVGYLDYFVLSFKRVLAGYGDQTVFRSGESLGNAISRFEIATPKSPVAIWDITNPLRPVIQEYQTSGSLSFSVATDSLRTFIMFSGNAPGPGTITAIDNQDLHGLATPDLLIITYSAFLPEALRLAAHREKQSGWQVVTVTTEQVFNEFSTGHEDVSALRDFAKYLFDKSPQKLKALLLFGKGSYDYKERVTDNTDFVPIYESRNSLHPLLSYSSDDYYGFLEPGEGSWEEDPPANHSMDISVGRLPVKTLEEARHVVDKIINYETGPNRFGEWRKQIVFVADDGDFNTHQLQADQMAEFVESGHPEFTTQKILVDAYPQMVTVSGELAPDATTALLNAFDHGALVVNYSGHGNEQLWAQERILDAQTIQKLDNKHLPLMVTATCEFGRHDDPRFASNGENLITRAGSGAIGLVSTSRLVQSSTNFLLNQAFYDALFVKENAAFLTIGEIFRRTKNNSQNGVSNRNFSLLCDPSLTLALPRNRIDSVSIKTVDASDTLMALSRVRAGAKVIRENGVTMDDFNGTAVLTLFDKRSSLTTLGDENAPFNYQSWKNKLYHGTVSVTGGEFSFEFIIPKNISYTIGSGKLNLYAWDELLALDASGSDQDFAIGSSSGNPQADVTAPDIKVYLGDSTFVNGGLVPPSTRIYARLHDESGISISAYGIGNGLQATIDDSATYALDDSYAADKDDFTHGTVSYPLRDLAPGLHRMVLLAWDTYNNPGGAETTFRVSNTDDLVIERFGCFPNPFNQHSTLYFTHNQSGDDLSGQVLLYSPRGELMRSFDFESYASPYWVELLQLDRFDGTGNYLPAGIYVARLILRSRESGVMRERVTKLIISN